MCTSRVTDNPSGQFHCEITKPLSRGFCFLVPLRFRSGFSHITRHSCHLATEFVAAWKQQKRPSKEAMRGQLLQGRVVQRVSGDKPLPGSGARVRWGASLLRAGCQGLAAGALQYRIAGAEKALRRGDIRQLYRPLSAPGDSHLTSADQDEKAPHCRLTVRGLCCLTRVEGIEPQACASG